jgi:MFS family permease
VSARYAALESADFRRLWSGLLVSNVGTWMQNVAQSWLIYRMTGDDPLYLGLLGLAFALPMTTLPPLGGAVADRVDRVKLLYVTQGAALSVALVLSLLAWSGALRPWHLLVAAFTGASLLAFDNPTRQALVPDLVPRADLQNALSLNASTFTGAALVGPAIAGALLGRIGAGWLFMLNAVSFLAVIGALARIDPRAHRHGRPRPEGGLRASVLGGLAYARGHRTVAALLGLSTVAALFARSYQQLLPIFAASVWRAGPGGYGSLLAAGGAGALLGALALSSARAASDQVRVMLWSGAALALSLLVFSRMPSLALGAGVLVLVGVSATVLTTMIATKIQLDVPRELRGRVIGLYTITLIGMPSLGSLAMAALARRVGAPAAVAMGAGVLSIAIVLGARALQVRGRERERAPDASGPSAERGVEEDPRRAEAPAREER